MSGLTVIPLETGRCRHPDRARAMAQAAVETFGAASHLAAAPFRLRSRSGSAERGPAQLQVLGASGASARILPINSITTGCCQLS
jgi:hypothetical protein